MPSMLRNNPWRVWFDANSRKRTLVFLALIFVALCLLRWPALVQYSIDDIPYLQASPQNSEKLHTTLLRWNRYTAYLFNTGLDTVFNLNRTTMATGYFILSAAMIGYIYSLLKLFKVETRIWSYLLIIYFCLYPIHYILFHFSLILYSLAIVFVTLMGLIWANSGKIKPIKFALTTMLATAIIAGSYQSGLYFLILTIAMLVYYHARQMAGPWEFIRLCLFYLAGIIAGLMIYMAIGHHVAEIVPPKNNALPRSVSDWPREFLTRLNNFRWFNQGGPLFTKWEKILPLAIAAAGGLWAFQLTSTKWPQKLALISLFAAFALCMMQIITLPTMFVGIPVRSFWFLSLILPFAAIIFMDVMRHRKDELSLGAQSLGLSLTAALVVLSVLHTVQISRGYLDLRKTDARIAENLAAQLPQLNRDNKPIAIAWSSEAQITQYHSKTIGAIRTLFWAEWSKYDYLAMTGLEFTRVPKEDRARARQMCRDTPNTQIDPRVTHEDDFMLVCF